MRPLIIAALLLFAAPAFAEDIGGNTVCFVPGPDDCAMVAVAEITKAGKTIDIQAYGFTEPHIAQALIDAHDRGVTVRLINDKTGPHEKNGQDMSVAQAGVPVWIDNKPRIAHNKVMVIDAGEPDAEVLTGSLNWTVAASSANAENLLIVRDPAMAAAYAANFEHRLAVSETLADWQAAHPGK